KNIKRKIIIEKFLKDKNGKSPKDYKFFVFHGKTKMIQVDSDRFENHEKSLFDENWNYIDVYYGYKKGKKIKKTQILNKAKKIAETLGKNFSHARIDLYILDNNIYLGEITHYSLSGMTSFKPRKYDFELGKNWKISKN
ncbi:MAG: ATP-grasp fold amidoligase family protein, partial [archaeon]